MKGTATATLFLILAFLPACHRQKPSAPAPVAGSGGPAAAPAAPTTSTSGGADRDAAERRAQAIRNTTNSLLAEILFEFDEYVLNDDARDALDQKVRILNDNPSIRIRAVGHADERGSDEYNLALGQRRAAAAKRFLSQNGIDSSRIEIVSVGEERGVCFEQTESCWSRNRRAAFEIVEGQVNNPIP